MNFPRNLFRSRSQSSHFARKVLFFIAVGHLIIAVPRKLWAQEALSFQKHLLKGYDPDLATENPKRSVAYLIFSAKTPKDLAETYATLLSAHAYQKYINEERSKKFLYKDLYFLPEDLRNK